MRPSTNSQVTFGPDLPDALGTYGYVNVCSIHQVTVSAAFDSAGHQRQGNISSEQGHKAAYIQETRSQAAWPSNPCR